MCCCKIAESDGKCCIPIWGVYVMAGVLFSILVLMLVLSICLCRINRRVKKLEAWKFQDQPDVHYASLQNLASAQTREEHPEPPSAHNTDYASVAELKRVGEEEKGWGGAGRPEEGAHPGDIVQYPQQGMAAV